MRVFVTGATGFIGSAIARELLENNHTVVGLARNEEAVAKLSQAGLGAVRGDLNDPSSLAAGARLVDGVIHTAYVHDFSNIQRSGEIDTTVVEAIADALAGTGKPLINVSGVALLKPGTIGVESDDPDPQSPAVHRIPSEKAGLAASKRGVRAMVVRPGASVHGDGDHGFIPMLIDIARKKGRSVYIGEGTNRWPAVHRLDAARLFRLALEKGVAGGRYHAVEGLGTPYRAIAEVIGRRLGVPVVSMSMEEAKGHFGGFESFVALDAPASNTQTRAELGWEPTHAGLLADIDRPEYYRN